jgi:hypothetical protein
MDMTMSSIRPNRVEVVTSVQRRKANLDGSLVAVGANESVVQASSELQDAMRRIKQLEGALGRKTLENEILKEAVDFAKPKSGLCDRLYCPGTSNKSCLHGSGRIAQQRIDQENAFI